MNRKFSQYDQEDAGKELTGGAELSIALRVPLDANYKEVRIDANRAFKSEMVQKVKEYQLKKARDLEETKKEINAKAAKDAKRYAKEIKQRDLEIRTRNQTYEAKR